jgi:hypothetical protein
MKILNCLFACLILSGCSTYNPPPSLPSADCDPFTDNSFFGPSTPNQNWRHAGGLVLGDIKAKRLAAKHILKAPAGWDCPDRIDNSSYCTPLESQGDKPWCAAYMEAQLLSASWWREFHVRHDFPEDQLYAAAKRYDGGSGDGTTLEAIMSAAQEKDWGVGLYAHLEPCEQVFEVEDVIFAIHKYGLVMVGLQITDGWNNLNKDGSIGPGTKPIGGHALLVSGYSKSCNAIWGPNWWGKAWGKNGWWVMTLQQFEAQFGYGYAAKITWEKER